MNTTSEPGYAVFRSFEGRSLTAYKDEAGVWTIGYGQTNDDAAVLGFEIKAGVKITEQQCEDLLRASVRRLYEPAVNAHMGPNVSQPAFDAGGSFQYNTGAIGRASWVTSFVAHNLPAVHSQILQWNKAGGNVLAGLARRRNREWMMISAGDYGPEGRSVPLDMNTGRPVATPVVPGAVPVGVQPSDTVIPAGASLTPWHARMDHILGTYRYPGAADNPAILEMAKVCKGSIAQNYTHDQIAWCALTVNYCLVSTGFKGDDSLLALDVRKIGTRLAGPAVGALATKERSGGGHTFIVKGRTASGQMVGTGGNQSGESLVCDETFDAAVCQFNWPAGYPLPPKVGIGTLPIVSVRPRTTKEYTREYIDGESMGDHPVLQGTVVPDHLDGTPGMLQFGDQGPEVKDFQRLLIAAGATLDADGDFGTDTEEALRKFQAAHPQLECDGIAGPATRAALARDVAAKASLKGTATKGTGTLVATGSGNLILGGHISPLWFAALGGAFAVVLVWTAWSYRDEIWGMIKRRFA